MTGGGDLPVSDTGPWPVAGDGQIDRPKELAMTDKYETTAQPAPRGPRVEQHERGWRAYCPDCTWNSGNLPFPDPDAALHMYRLHQELCEGR